MRGAYFVDNGWFLGGSTRRHDELLGGNVEIYYFDTLAETVQKKEIPGQGEIYEILPWKDEIMTPIIKRYFSQPLAPEIQSLSTLKDAQGSNPSVNLAKPA